MRAQYLTAGVLILAAACSTPAAEVATDTDTDARDGNPDLALSAPLGAVPVASGIEVHQQEVEAEHDHGTPAPPAETDVAAPEAEPSRTGQRAGSDPAPAQQVAEAPLTADASQAVNHVHPKAPDPGDAVGAVARGPSAESGTGGESTEGVGGKPTDVSTGLGPVPDRNWGDPAIIDDPDPLAGALPGVGRAGAVIIRGGAGGVDDDCAIHPRGGVAAVPATAPGALVNDRAPRTGTSINPRAPRSTQRPSLPRGGGFPRGGIR